MKTLIAALARLFLRLKSDRPQTPTAPDLPRLHIAVVVGHNSNPKERGAFAPQPIGLSEWEFNDKLAREMQALAATQTPSLKLSVVYRTAEAGAGYSEETRRAYAEVDALKADASIELHFNAASSASARYALVLSSGSAKSLALAKAFDTAFERAFPGKPSKIWNHRKGEVKRGAKSLIAGKPPAVLLEPFFASNPTSLKEMAILGITGLARLYLGALDAYRKEQA